MSSVDVNVKSVATASYVFGNELKLRGEAKRRVVQLFEWGIQVYSRIKTFHLWWN